MTIPYEAEFQESGAGAAHVAFTVPAAAVTAELERIAQGQLGSIGPIKGFRPGRAPAEVRLAKARGRAMQLLPEELIRQSLEQLLFDREIFLVSEPRIVASDVKKGEPFRYAADLEYLLLPRVEGYEVIELDAAELDAGDEGRKQAVMRRLVECNKIEPPESLVALRAAELAQAGGVSKNEELLERARQELATTLMLDAVAAQEKLEVAPEEIRKAKVSYATSLGLGFAEVEAYAAQAAHSAELVRELKREKASALLMSRITATAP